MDAFDPTGMSGSEANRVAEHVVHQECTYGSTPVGSENGSSTPRVDFKQEIDVAVITIALRDGETRKACCVRSDSRGRCQFRCSTVGFPPFKLHDDRWAGARGPVSCGAAVPYREQRDANPGG